jgi:signal transduction histidine kinase
LLTLTRADAGALNLQPSQVNLNDLARTRMAHLGGLAAQRQVNLRLIGPTVWVWADPDRLAQVLDNLLDNAIRYSPHGADVTITITPAQGQVACAIADSGPGIPAQHLPFIFERFYRADPSRSRSRGNSGLGLAIAHALVTAHGGRIVAQSLEGKGTSLTFTLPINPNCP